MTATQPQFGDNIGVWEYIPPEDEKSGGTYKTSCTIRNSRGDIMHWGLSVLDGVMVFLAAPLEMTGTNKDSEVAVSYGWENETEHKEETLGVWHVVAASATATVLSPDEIEQDDRFLRYLNTAEPGEPLWVTCYIRPKRRRGIEKIHMSIHVTGIRDVLNVLGYQR